MKRFTVELSETQMEYFRSFLIRAILDQKEQLCILREDSKAPDVEPEELKIYEKMIAQREKELEATKAVLRCC